MTVEDPGLPADPAARFREVYEALARDRRWFQGVVALRFAAITAVRCPGSAEEVAAGIKSAAEALKEASSWTGPFQTEVRFVLGAALVKCGDIPRTFLEETERIRKAFRDSGVRRGGMYEVLAILILRQRRQLAPIPLEDVQRLRSIYDEMKKHHWWLTGPDDLPACAILVAQEGSPVEIAARAEGYHDALHQAGARRGNPLQTAANLLVLSGDSPSESARRFFDLEERFSRAGLWMHGGDYDELAILTFLRHPTDRILERVLTHRATVEELRPKPGKEMSFDLASSLAFLELVGRDEDMHRITGVKAIMDMQAVLDAQQVAAISAAASAAAAASASHG